MKKLSFLALSVGIAVSAMAQSDDYVLPLEFPEVFLQKVSPGATFASGQDLFGSACYVFDISRSGEMFFYEAAYPGDGNCLADDGTLVGQDIATSKPVIMSGGEITTPKVFSTYMDCQFNGITPDGRLVVGYAGVPSWPLYLPVVYDRFEEKAEFLPYPAKDFFGFTPQGITLIAVSDDGTVITGMVKDNSGMYNWPIVYRQQPDGSWAYTQPTEKDFNPGGLVPPGDPEKTDDWDSYWKTLQEMGRNQMYAGATVLSADGKRMVVDRMVVSGEYASTEPDGLVPFLFNLEDDTYAPLPNGGINLAPTQFLPDGTVVAMSTTLDFLPYTTYMLLPGADSFVLFTDWLHERIPQYYYWLEDTFGQYNVIGYDPEGNPIYADYIISGLISFNSDMSVIAGGMPFGDGFSYVYYDPTATVGVDAIETENDGAPLIYYNLQGIPVKDPGHGIYIVNGKKVLVN